MDIEIQPCSVSAVNHFGRRLLHKHLSLEYNLSQKICSDVADGMMTYGDELRCNCINPEDHGCTDLNEIAHTIRHEDNLALISVKCVSSLTQVKAVVETTLRTFTYLVCLALKTDNVDGLMCFSSGETMSESEVCDIIREMCTPSHSRINILFMSPNYIRLAVVYRDRQIFYTIYNTEDKL